MFNMSAASREIKSGNNTQSTQIPLVQGTGDRKMVCLFANIGAGHLNPMLVLAARLTALGWTVLFYAHSNARQKVSSSGAVWRSYGSENWDLFNTAKYATAGLLSMPPDPLLDMSIVSAGLPATLVMLPYLLAEIRLHRPLFTVHDAAAPWGALAGRIAGLHTVCSVSAFPLTPAQAAETYPPGPIQKAATRYLLRQYDLNYDPAATYINYTDFNLVFTARFWAGDRFKADPPYYFCGPTPLPSTNDEVNHPAIHTAKSAKAAGKKVIYGSFGTVVSGPLSPYYRRAIQHIFAQAIEALSSRDDVHLILSAGRKPLGDKSQPSVVEGTNKPLPASVSMFEYTPQPKLLEYTDVFLTHAGMNSTNEAAWYGVPVVCCPFFGDGVLNAKRFAEFGAGITVDYRIATPAQIAAGHVPFSLDDAPSGAMHSALVAVLDDSSYRRAAVALKHQFRQETNLDQNIDVMLEWVEPHRSHSKRA